MICKIRKILREKRGFTLVEEIVTFALFALLTTAAALVLSGSMKVYYQEKSTASAMFVAQTILEKVNGEISGALPAIMDGIIEGTNHHITISEDNTMIELDEKTGSSIYIFAEASRLTVHYRAISDGNLHLDPVDWTFGDEVYKGFKISKLEFEIVEEGAGEKTNVIRINLSLKNDTNTTYNFTSYSECFNYPENGDNITYGKITTDD